MTAADQAATPAPPRVGLFGGTFNPIHIGHLWAAEAVVEALDLERMIFVPSAQPPHKSRSRGGPIAPAEQRLAWVRAAVAGNPRFAVDSLEIERAGPSYSLDTLSTFHARLAPELPVFVIGLDAFGELDTWHEAAALFALAHFAVIRRPRETRGRLADWLPECARDDVVLAPDGLSGRHRSAGSWLRLIEIAALDISASEIRTRLRAGRSVRYLLPEAVLTAVTESGTYAKR
jgi:nicotinate-nucleotide adenylyltransferase